MRLKLSIVGKQNLDALSPNPSPTPWERGATQNNSHSRTANAGSFARPDSRNAVGVWPASRAKKREK